MFFRDARWALLLGIAAALPTGPAAAQRELYEPVPPRGSAYVRFVNALGAEVALRPDFLPAARLAATPAGRVGSYTVVERAANRSLTVEAREGDRTTRATFRAEPGSFVTVVLQPRGDGIVATPLVDNAEFNRARARLSFYNLVPDCPDGALALEPSGPAVFEGVAPNTAKVRSVNPVNAQVRARCGNRAAPPVALEGMEAGGTYSMWLMQPGAEPIAFLARDTTTPYRP